MMQKPPRRQRPEQQEVVRYRAVGPDPCASRGVAQDAARGADTQRPAQRRETRRQRVRTACRRACAPRSISRTRINSSRRTSRGAASRSRSATPDRRRNLYLDREQRRALIAAADGPDLALFLRALSLSPLRPGALAALTVADFDKRLRQLRIGRDKTGGDRRIRLPDATAAIFEQASRDKLPSAALFVRADGAPWNRDMWKRCVRLLLRPPSCPRAQWHTRCANSSVITDLVHSGLDVMTVAQVAGTSVLMIQKHYGHLRGNVAIDALAKLAL